MSVALSRDPDDRWIGNRTFSVRGTDATGPVTVVIDEDDWVGIVDVMAIESPDPDDVDGALTELEKLASRQSATTTENGRIIDLRPRFS